MPAMKRPASFAASAASASAKKAKRIGSGALDRWVERGARSPSALWPRLFGEGSPKIDYRKKVVPLF